jgi:hypothetical protein
MVEGDKMKQEYIIPLGGTRTEVPEIRASRDLRIRPGRCLECGHVPEVGGVVEDMGREFGEFLYYNVDGQFWNGLRKFFQEHDDS